MCEVKMKWFGRSPGYWLFWTGAIYFIISMAHLTWFKDSVPQGAITLTWLIFLSLPLVVPQLRRYLNMAPLFEKEESVSKEDKDTNEGTKVLKFPEPPKLKAVEPELDVSRAPYSLGINDAGNIQFSMKNDYGTTTLTMTDEGVVGLIEDLAHYIRKSHTVDIKAK